LSYRKKKIYINTFVLNSLFILNFISTMNVFNVIDIRNICFDIQIYFN